MDSPILAAQTAAREPLDHKLIEAIRADLYALEAAITAAGAFDFQYKVNSYLDQLRKSDGTFTTRRRFDGGQISRMVTFSSCRIFLEESGDSGTVEVDLRRYNTPNVLIQSVAHLFKDSVTSIAQRGSAQNTQSIARTTAQISTQSVARWKTQLNVQSIVLLGNGLVQYNLNNAPDADWLAGDTATFASCTTGANNGSFPIVRTNNNGGNNVVVTNASGVKQDSVAGTCDLDAWKFTYTNPVSSEFAAGESATFASHTSGANNGTFPIYAINQGGNNIILKGASYVAQGGAAGTADTNRWAFALSSSAPAYFVVGESVATASHSSGGNNGTLRITAVNSGGNNICLYNASGVAQGGAAGTISCLRWVYAFATDPSSGVSVGDKVWSPDVTSSANQGEFTVKEVNVSSGLNVVVYNASGVAQGGAVGTLYTDLVKLNFASDQSSYITTSSRLTLAGTSINSQTLGNIDGDYDVVQVNRGGGVNYNAVVSIYGAYPLAGPCGRVVYESKSIFTTRPSLSISAYAGKWADISSNAVFDATQKVCPANTLIMADLLQIPTGKPKNLVVQLY